MRGYTFALLLIAVTCEAIKIEISKPTAAAQTNVTNETSTAPPTTTTPTPTTLPTTTTTAATKPPTRKPSTAHTSTMTTTTTIVPSTTTTHVTPSSGAEGAKAPVVTPNNGSVSKVPCRDHSCFETFCVCNLMHGICDIDCCCDPDCGKEELKAFDCIREKGGFDEFNIQMTLSPCHVDGGYLCVFRSNFDKNMIMDLKFDLDSPATNDWPSVLLERSEPPDEQNFYKINDPILLYNLEANEIIELDIPFSLTGQHCQSEESIRHLGSKTTSCHVSLEKAQAMEAKLYQKLCTSLLLQRPNIRAPSNGIIKETQVEFLTINLFRCTSDGDCTPASIFNSTLDMFDESEYSSRIHIKIFHNITDLLACDVFFERAEQRSARIWQHFEVSFVHGNGTNPALHNVSGPLGYNQGAPLIIAHKVLLNESAELTASNSVLNYFHPNRTASIHIHPPRRRQNSCERSEDMLNFGESILVQCAVQLDNATELNSETNFTKVCFELQNRSLDVLAASDILHLQEEYFISARGYPSNEMNHWVRIIVKNYEQLPVVGVYLEKQYGFMCQNIILGLKYEFVTLTETVEGVSNQPTVKRASIDVGRRHDLQFQLDEVISVPLTFSVIFRDPREANGSEKWSQSRVGLIVLVNLFGYVLVY